MHIAFTFFSFIFFWLYLFRTFFISLFIFIAISLLSKILKPWCFSIISLFKLVKATFIFSFPKSIPITYPLSLFILRSIGLLPLLVFIFSVSTTYPSVISFSITLDTAGALIFRFFDIFALEIELFSRR